MGTQVAGPGLLQAALEGTATEWWNDSCVAAELEMAIAGGATGATSNPPLVLDMLRQEPLAWAVRVRELQEAHPGASETDLAWSIIEAAAIRGAGLLEPVFRRTAGRAGRLSVQVSPLLHRDADAMLAQAEHLASLAPNIAVKLPVTAAGLVAIEEATARGIHVNATVNFTVAGALAVAEAVERGLTRHAVAGHDASSLRPVCTLMIGRLEDWLKVVCARDGVLLTPGSAEWSGVAVFKRAHALYREHGYRTRLLAGAFRNHLPWSQLIGGDIVITIPAPWQRLLETSPMQVGPRLDEPVDEGIVAELLGLLPDFRRAWEPDGLTHAELETYGACVRTLRAFIAALREVESHVRDTLLPDPDLRA